MMRLRIFTALAAIVFLSACAKRPVVKPPEPVDVEVTREEPGVRGEWESIPELAMIHFDFDKYEIRADARAVLVRNSEHLKANPELTVLVEGHCDERGTTEYNLALGQRRASAVREYYMRLGVAAARIATISYGEEKPLIAAFTEAAMARNRRAETKIGRPRGEAR